MPIVECGFTAVSLNPGVTPQLALVRVGPGILVDIGFDAGVLTQTAAGAPVQPPTAGSDPNIRQVLALIDTGAMESCIDDDLARQLNLPLVDQQQTAGVGGTHVLNVYLAFVAIPILGTVQAGRFVGAHLAAGGQPHHALIGRTLLADTLLVYDGRSGSVKLAR